MNQYFVIASDSSIIPLLNHDINVDLIISIDPNIGTLYHFYDYKEKLESIPVLSWLGARNELHRFFKNIYYFLTGFPLDFIIKQYDMNLMSIETKTNDVLGYALQIANNNKIDFVGCGLKTSLRQYYIANTGYDYYALIRSHRTFSKEHYHFKLYQNQSYKRRNFNPSNIPSEKRERKPSIDSVFFYKEFTWNEFRYIFSLWKKEIITSYPYFKIFFDLLEIH